MPRVIAAARAAGKDHGDLLSMLLLARDEDTGEGMTDQQVHDEVVTILTAGTETTAVALAWFFHERGSTPRCSDASTPRSTTFSPAAWLP